MKDLGATVLAAGLFATATAIQLLERDTPNVVGLDINRRSIQDPVKRDALRRRQTVAATLDNGVTLYYANVSLGTPSQNLRLHIDTGSSDLWANSRDSRICSYRGDPCSVSGTYDANSSSSYRYLDSDFSVQYVDESGASGDYVTDTVSIGGQTIKSMQFGVGYNSTSPQGILGIGYTANEAQVDDARQRPYSNLPQALVDNGLIKSNAYSLWLDDLESSTGSILFGGVDTNRYHGELQSLPIQQEFNTYAEFIITLSAMSLNSNGNNTSLTTDLPVGIILDSGSSLTYLPDDLARQIYNDVGATYRQNEGAATIDCSLAKANTTLDFTFTSPTISVPMRELVLSGDSGDSENRQDPNSENGGSQSNSGQRGSQCIFGIAPSEGSNAVLGDTFLRSAYVVYDLANNQISLAQTNFNATDSRVVEIGKGSNSVPGATTITSAIQAQVSESGGARIGGTGTSGLGSISTAGAESKGAASMSLSYGSFLLVAGNVLALSWT